MSDDPLNPLLDADHIAVEHVGPESLASMAGRVTTHPPHEFILAGARMPGLWDEQDRPSDYLEIHDRDWWIDARPAANRDYLATLLAAAAIADALRLDHTLWWLTTVLPALATLESITVDEGGVHLTMYRRLTAELPRDLAEDIHPQDFADFAEVLAGASTVVPLPAGGTLTFVDSPSGH
jgi:hypothetical protein